MMECWKDGMGKYSWQLTAGSGQQKDTRHYGVSTRHFHNFGFRNANCEFGTREMGNWGIGQIGKIVKVVEIVEA